MSNTTTVSSGVSLPWVLTIIFIVLKLTGTIDWSWWWVLAPVLIAYAIIIVTFTVAIFLLRSYYKTPRGALELYSRSLRRK